MKIHFGGIQLTDWSDYPARNVSVNGETVVEAVDIVRAAAKQFYHLGNTQVSLSFEVERKFATHVEAQIYLLTHYSLLPKSALCQIECGVQGETSEDVFMPNAILSSSPLGIFGGVSVVVAYTIQAGEATTDVPPDFLIGGEAMILRGKEALASGIESKAVVFSQSFPPGTTVVVHAGIAKPDGSGSNLFATIRDDLTDVNGFTVELSNVTPDANHKLPWIAIGIAP
ncbi:MAG TPA: hypothetical protein VNP98_17425 [Chthoniobacterales bacterium]|nr:hypothetical protein [Chthoniobacterales bacterium]